MRLPRVQLTVRRMMIVVIVVILFALAFLTETSRHINPKAHPGQLSPIHRLQGGSRRRSSRSIVASTKFVRVWPGSHPRRPAAGHTIIEMAPQLDIDPQWIYRAIAKGRIEISKDLRYGCYLFPRTKAVVTRMKQLFCGVACYVA